MNKTYSFNFTFRNLQLNTSHQYDRPLFSRDYADKEAWQKDISEKYNLVLDTLKQYRAEYIVSKNTENGIEIIINVKDTPIDLELVVSIEHIFTQPHFNKFIELKYFAQELEALEYAKEVWKKQPTYTYMNVFEVQHYNKDGLELTPYILVFSEENFLTLERVYSLVNKHGFDEITIYTDLINGSLLKHDVIVEGKTITLSAISVNAILDIIEGGLEEGILFMINTIREEHNLHVNIKRLGDNQVTQGLDQTDNPNLINDVLVKPDIVYIFKRDNEHDTRVVQHSILHYRDDKEYTSCLFTNGDDVYFLISKTVRRYINEHNDKLQVLGIIPTIVDTKDAEGITVDSIGLYVKDNKVLSENEVTDILYLISYGTEYRK